ncbi:hypothetical protein GGS23DRAFT_11929 [Durotheca rogersii]|uniref:uncharacterized protein n=1 Tax=Durotheca rogersii TaxID=419775 RepID=UPI00221E70D0|nr:uncharacterized protein GGS23DRAFT_11929 [Durotheca rogersii]KAI5868112.1 hypothetical protein GGS23DRAFT_11929 [Durotheca rogersii]
MPYLYLDKCDAWVCALRATPWRARRASRLTAVGSCALPTPSARRKPGHNPNIISGPYYFNLFPSRNIVSFSKLHHQSNSSTATFVVARMRAKWRKKRVRRLKRKRRKMRARSKRITTTRSRHPLHHSITRHDKATFPIDMLAPTTMTGGTGGWLVKHLSSGPMDLWLCLCNSELAEQRLRKFVTIA